MTAVVLSSIFNIPTQLLVGRTFYHQGHFEMNDDTDDVGNKDDGEGGDNGDDDGGRLDVVMIKMSAISLISGKSLENTRQTILSHITSRPHF